MQNQNEMIHFMWFPNEAYINKIQFLVLFVYSDDNPIQDRLLPQVILSVIYLFIFYAIWSSNLCTKIILNKNINLLGVDNYH